MHEITDPYDAEILLQIKALKWEHSQLCDRLSNADLERKGRLDGSVVSFTFPGRDRKEENMNQNRNFWIGALTGVVAVVIAKSGLLKRTLPAPAPEGAESASRKEQEES